MPLEIIAWRGAALFVSADTGLRLLSLMAIRSGRAGEAKRFASAARNIGNLPRYRLAVCQPWQVTRKG